MHKNTFGDIDMPNAPPSAEEDEGYVSGEEDGAGGSFAIHTLPVDGERWSEDEDAKWTVSIWRV